MKFKAGLTVGIVVAFIIVSRLLGDPVGASRDVSTLRVMTRDPLGEPIHGKEVALAIEEQVRLHAGATVAAPIVYTIEGGKVWVGDATVNPSVYTIEGRRLVRSLTNEVMYTISGNRIYRGSNTTGGPAYTIEGHRVYSGDSTSGEPLISFVGNHVHWGAGAAGHVMLTATAEIEGDPILEFLMPVLLLERF